MTHRTRLAPALLLAAAAALAPALARATEALAEQHACLNCHQVDRKLVGPSFKAVAEKYRGRDDAAELLLAKISRGGAGVWGTVPMPAMTLPPDDARAIISWVLKQ